MGLHEAAALVAEAIRARPKGTRWLLECDLDADGLCAAAVAAAALQAVGQRFVVRASRDKEGRHYEALAQEAWDALMLLDKGTSHAATLGRLAGGRMVVVVDHHSVPPQPPQGVHLLNPRLEGLDGSRDASGATTALALAYALCGTKAAAWTATALAGAMGDWQHMGGWRGWNLEAVRRAREAGHLREARLPRLVGLDLAEAMAQPRTGVPGFAGDVEGARAFLQGLGLPPEAEAEDLALEQQTALVSALALHLVAHGHSDKAESLVGPMDLDRNGRTVRRRFRVVDACAREERPDVGIAWLLGDPSAEAEALACFARYRATIRDGIAQVRRGIQARTALQWLEIARAPYTGMVAGVAMAHLLDPARPVCVLAPRPDGRLQVSTRGTHEQVAAGMDLAHACASAAAAVGSEGGGHPVSAGAVIDAPSRDAFLEALDDALVRQAFLPKA